MKNPLTEQIQPTAEEIEFLLSSTEALTLLADYHSCQETMAEAEGYGGEANGSRREQFTALAEEAQKRIDAE